MTTNYIFEIFQLKKAQSKEPVSEISSSSSDKGELNVDVNRKRKV